MTRARRVPFLLAAVGSALLLACESPTATRPTFAYNPTALTNGQLYRWENGSVIRVYVDPTEVATLDVTRAVRTAVAAWNAIPRFAEFRLEITGDASVANVIVFDRSRPVPIVTGGCAFDARGAVGYTYFCPNGARAERLNRSGGGGGMTSVVVRVDRALMTSQTALDAIMTHEFGHALGIGAHSGTASDVMFGLPSVTTPSARDAATMQYVLGRPADFVL